jgi:acyl-CoA synthetase (AMP-forming)/AMP-acid ligase II
VTGRPATADRPSVLGDDLLLPEVLTARAALDPDRRAQVFLDSRGEEEAVVTYGDLHARSLAVAAWLTGRCAPGQRALLIFPQGPDFTVAFFGCLYARVIAVPVNPPSRGRLTEAARSIAGDCEPAAVLTTSGMRPECEATLPPARQARHWLAVDRIAAGASPLPGWGGLPVEVFSPAPADAGAIAFLQYTSGSTSDPKGVMVSHGNLRANEAMIRRAFGHDQDSTVVGWAPFFHDQGLIGNVLQPLCVGATSVLLSPMTFARWPLRWLAAISRYRAHTSGGPNFAFDACVARAAGGTQPEPGLDLSCWKVAFNGAEPVQPQTLRRFAETFAPYGFAADALYPCYGLAEATLLVTGSRKGRGPRILEADPEQLGRGRLVRAPAGQGRTLAGSGQVPPGEDVRIVAPGTGRPCAPGRVGEIWVAGEHVARGYWRRPEETAATFGAACAGSPQRRYLRTGDLGVIDEGELYVVGRRKDLVIIRGRNYYPQDIEQTVAAAHPALRPACCAAFSVPGAEGGECLVVVAEVRPDEARRAGASDIAGSIRAAIIAGHQLSVGDLLLTLPGQLPKTSSGKIMRAAARKRYADGGFRTWPARPSRP